MDRRFRVADFSTHFSGPIASQLLAQLGADVIKIENPRTGDGNRGTEPFIAGEAMVHIAVNAGTRSLAADRHSSGWPALIDACARWADVVVVGARPTDAQRRGLDFSSLIRSNPRLVYCLITGYGLAGPWRDYPAHGLNMDALAGLVPLDWHDGQPTAREDYQSVGPTLAGVFAALGIMTGLHRRHLEGTAQHVHVSVWGAAMAFNWRHLTTYSNLHQPWLAYRDLGSRYAMYATSDGRALLVCPIERRYWEAFCDVVGLPAEWKGVGDWDGGGGMEMGKSYDHERQAIALRIGERTLADWQATLSAASIPFAPVLDWREALVSEHATANGVMRRTTVNGQDVQIAANPVVVGPAEAHGVLEPLGPPPRVGQHTDEILAELGLDKSGISLRADAAARGRKPR